MPEICRVRERLKYTQDEWFLSARPIDTMPTNAEIYLEETELNSPQNRGRIGEHL